jgi:transaldolase
VEAIEEATYRGVSINATVSFTVAQALAVAEAVERGLGRREKEGQDVSAMGPVCTIMVGRIDDWLKVVAGKEGIVTHPGYLDWAGVAIMKKAYRLYRERGYRLRLLAAAYRSLLHWSEFIGGEMVVSIPFRWQKLFNASDIEIVPRMDRPVDPEIIDELYRKIADFRRAHDEGGMNPGDFDHFGPTRRTLRGFIAGYEDFAGFIRDLILPNPDA